MTIPRRPLIQLYQSLTGRRFLDRLDELNRQQWLNRDALLYLQRNKLHKLLAHAYNTVPYYTRLFDDVGFAPDDVLDDLSHMQKIPLLTKEIIRANFDDLQTQDPALREELSQVSTSGSSGKPLVFLQDNQYRDYVTADVHRHLGWAGWDLGTPHCYIWGARFEIKAKQSLRSQVMDWVLNRFVTNAYVLSDETMEAFVAKIRQRKPKILFFYPSSVQRFAEFVREQGYDDIKFDAMLSSAEVLYPEQRAFIEETFGGGILDRYGTREVGGLGCQCNSDSGLHVSVENVYIELLNQQGYHVPPGEVGNVVVTNLNNHGMPFIRYDLSDSSSWQVQDGPCECGRAHPMLNTIHGRQIDMFRTKDNRVIWGGLNTALWEVEGVRQFQYVQKALDHVLVRIAKDTPLSDEEAAHIKRNIHQAMGEDVHVSFEFPDEILPEASGKYRYQISEIK